MSPGDNTADGQQRTAPSQDGWKAAIALLGFVLVATAQVTNMILARGLHGEVPPFTLAFFRWTIIAAGLAPFAVADMGRGRLPLRANALPILSAGFLGMFLCGAPVYIAGMTTTAINIALIMSLSPIVVLLLSRLFGLEQISTLQVIGMGLALVGVVLIVSRGDPRTLTELRTAPGDLLMLLPMLGWSGYTLLQSRVAPSATFLARVSVFAAAGALFTLPVAAWEMWRTPQAVFTAQAFAAYVFAGLVPGLLAYGGFAYLGSRFGSVQASISVYLAPVASALLSLVILGEPPSVVHIIGGTLILGAVWASLRN
ncbi:MAG: DMT family transporter [Reyranella sp.]|nr:DMT family transporter [Reyranella sp.]